MVSKIDENRLGRDWKKSMSEPILVITSFKIKRVHCHTTLSLSAVRATLTRKVLAHP
jgi:hypothetical protein